MEVLGYLVVEGSRISNKDAAIYGTELLKGFGKANNPPTPADVVKFASKKSSPLHDYFEWDDSEAARKYREEQAVYLLRSIRVSYSSPQGPRVVRLFISVPDDADGALGSRSYHLGTRVANDAELRGRHIVDLKKRLFGIKRELVQFEEFVTVVQAIDALSEVA